MKLLHHCAAAPSWGRLPTCGRLLIGPASEARPRGHRAGRSHAGLWQAQRLAEGGLTTRRRLTTCPTLLTLLLLASCGKPTPLEVFGQVPEFQLTTQSGDAFDSRSLAGHIWVADFFYTTCDGPCPMMTRQMRQLQDSTAGAMRDVRLVSFTVDPGHDTPPVLTAYARHFRTNPARWWFLTGEQSRLNGLGLAFKLNSVDGSLIHSTRFVLVDRRMRVRGYYITSEDGVLPQLMRDIRQLERDPS